MRNDIIYPVVTRETSHVHPAMIRLLASITEEDNEEFQREYRKVSTWARRHDNVDELNANPPKFEDMDQALACAEAWYKRIKNYKNAH